MENSSLGGIVDLVLATEDVAWRATGFVSAGAVGAGFGIGAVWAGAGGDGPAPVVVEGEQLVVHARSASAPVTAPTRRVLERDRRSIRHRPRSLAEVDSGSVAWLEVSV